LEHQDFKRGEGRVANREAFDRTINDTMQNKTRAEWSRLLTAVDVPNAPIQNLGEVVEHPQTIESGIYQKNPDGSFRLTGLPLLFNGERPPFRANAPELGEATQEVFAFMES